MKYAIDTCIIVNVINDHKNHPAPTKPKPISSTRTPGADWLFMIERYISSPLSWNSQGVGAHWLQRQLLTASLSSWTFHLLWGLCSPTPLHGIQIPRVLRLSPQCHLWRSSITLHGRCGTYLLRCFLSSVCHLLLGILILS